MIDMKWIRNDPEKVKENIRKKFQDEKLPLVDEVVELDKKFREAKVQGDELRSQRKSISKKSAPSAPSWKSWKRQRPSCPHASVRSCW